MSENPSDVDGCLHSAWRLSRVVWVVTAVSAFLFVVRDIATDLRRIADKIAPVAAESAK